MCIYVYRPSYMLCYLDERVLARGDINPVLIRGVIVVTFTLIFYSVGVIIEQRKC